MDRAGVIFKKCDISLHRPGSNRACAAQTCQHTCKTPDKCQHAWTLRYWANGRQREQSFRDDIDQVTGRVKYGTGKRKARDAQLKIEHDKRAEGAAFIDPRSGREDFCEALDAFISRQSKAENTMNGYLGVASKWVKPAFEGKSLAQVANDRDRVADLLAKDMAHLHVSRRKVARLLITGVLDEAVKGGKLARHFVGGISVGDNEREDGRADFVFPSYGQIRQVAENAGIAVWLMRGCGLRIEEAIAVHKEDFRSPRTLRLTGQATRDGRRKVALKGRKPGEYRDAPVPGWLWEMVKDLPDGPLCPGTKGCTYATYGSVLGKFQRASARAGIPRGFRPHSLRHAFASTLLSRGVPITDVARWLGHKDINVTYAIYSHFMPEAEDRAQEVLNAEYAEWSNAT
jgi:integrase